MLKNIFRKRKKRTLILGIHGLSNKPPKLLLSKWWRSSIEEGLSKIKGSPVRFDFKMVYWADILYKEPLLPHIKDPESPLFIDEPYFSERELKTPPKITYWQRFKNFVQYVKEIVFLSKLGLNKFRRPFNMIVKIGFNDLDIYYNENLSLDQHLSQEPFKTRVRRRLKRVLKKHRKKDVYILAHSMGSIIAYDVLLALKDEINVKGFVALGSPLGLPLIRENIMVEHKLEFNGEPLPPTPEAIDNWYSLCDSEDNIGAFYNLSEFYLPNTKGVKPIGKFVNNDYKNWITDNAHKSFGYLRTPELAEVLTNFLNDGRSSLLSKGREFFSSKKK